MTFDVQQVVEAAARAHMEVEWPQYLGKPTRIDLEAARAALAVIVLAVTEQIRELHKPREVGPLAGYCVMDGIADPCPTLRLCDELDAAARGEWS